MQKRMSNFAVTVHGIINPRQTTFTTMAEQTQTMPDYIGTVLTNGAFLKMHQSYRDLIEKSNPANMKCDALLATYKAALKKMALFVGSEQGFIETADLQVLDQKRDSMWLALYYYVHYLAQLPVDNVLDNLWVSDHNIPMVSCDISLLPYEHFPTIDNHYLVSSWLSDTPSVQ